MVCDNDIKSIENTSLRYADSVHSQTVMFF